MKSSFFPALTLNLGAALLAAITVQASVTPEGDVSPGVGDAFWTSDGNASATAYIGYQGSGSVSMDGGSTMESGNIFLGFNETDYGELKLTGSGTTWTATRTNVIGFAGSGEVSVTDGAHLVGSIDFIGHEETGVGTVLVKGSGSQWSSGGITVGHHGTGTLNVTDGGKVVTTHSFTVQNVDPLAPASSTATGTLNLGVSKNAVLVQAGGTFTNNGTINAYALGNIAAGDITLVTASSLAGDGEVNAWGGSIGESTATFAVSAFTTYTGAIADTDLSGARVNVGEGDAILSFADNAGIGGVSVEEVTGPGPSGYNFYEAAEINFTGLENSAVILSVFMGSGYDEDSITAWMWVGGSWEQIDMDNVVNTYEEEYYSFMLDQSGIYAVTGNLVPEPGHYAALAGLLALVGAMIYRRRR